MKTTLPTDSTVRKSYGLARYCDNYFPAALAGIALHSFVSGAKHTNGVPMHKRWLSNDHADCVRRHLMDMADFEAALDRMAPGAPSQCREQLVRLLLDEANALAWRACALSQVLHEKYGGAPLAPAAVLTDPNEKPTVEANADDYARAGTQNVSNLHVKLDAGNLGKMIDDLAAKMRADMAAIGNRRWRVIGVRSKNSRKAKRSIRKAGQRSRGRKAIRSTGR
jgi:hypothetical protein